MIIEEAVYQEHEDSSDDEQLTDKAFLQASKHLTVDLMNQLADN